MNVDLERVLAWSRYLYWSELNYKRFDEYTESHSAVSDGMDWNWFALLGQWYASVWTVVEGWTQLKLQDETIDTLLTSRPDFTRMLKRYRNGIYHYQPRLIEERFREFLQQGETSVSWTSALRDAFQEFMWNLTDRMGGTPEQVAELRKAIKGTSGWEEPRTPLINLAKFRETLEHGEMLLGSASNPDEPHTRDFRRFTDAAWEEWRTMGESILKHNRERLEKALRMRT